MPPGKRLYNQPVTLYDFSEMFETRSVEEGKGSAGRRLRIKSLASRPVNLFKRRPSPRTVIKIAVLIAAATAALFPLPAGLIERFYSNGLYPWLQSWLTPFANLLPFALIDALLIALVLGLPIWWAVRIRRAGRGRRKRAVAALALTSLVLAGAIFLSFQLLWGIEPYLFAGEASEQSTLFEQADRLLLDSRLAERGESVVVMAGRVDDIVISHSMKLHLVGDLVPVS